MIPAIVVFIYLAVVVYIGIFAFRKATGRGKAEDYFLASRSLTAYPLVFGFVPIGLFYHACFTVACALVMWMLVTFAWPSHLEAESEADAEREGGAR